MAKKAPEFEKAVFTGAATSDYRKRWVLFLKAL
jgi:hypothetical protein